MEIKQSDGIEQEESIIAPLQKVTPLSKYLAMALFILLPFFAAWVGYLYAPEKVAYVPVTNQVSTQISKDVAEVMAVQTDSVTNTNSLQIVNCAQDTEDISGLPLSSIKDALDIYRGDSSDFMNDDFVEVHLENKITEKVGFHCVLNDGSVILSIFKRSVGDLSIVRIANNIVTNEAVVLAAFGSHADIVPKFDSTTVAFEGHIIDPCYDLTQNFKFDLTNFSLDLISVTGGDITNCEANI